MGQCYTVEAEFHFKNNDPTSFARRFKEEILKRNGKGARFDLSRGDLNDPFDCFKILTSKNADKFENVWYADFNASYGWEKVLEEVFMAISKELDNGSWIDIYPDFGRTEIRVENGEVIISDGWEEENGTY